MADDTEKREVGSGLTTALAVLCVLGALLMLFAPLTYLAFTLAMGVLCGWIARTRGLDGPVYGMCGFLFWLLALPMALLAEGSRLVAQITVWLFVASLVVLILIVATIAGAGA